jgi:branched-chain amino acid transport system ATP-binding protein
MLEATGIHGGYGAVEVLRGVDLGIAEGELVALLGSNGVGKTTFAAALSGLVRCRSGSVRFQNREIGHLAPSEIVAAGLIQVPEGRHIFPNLTVRENLELGAYRRATKSLGRNLGEVLDTFPRLRERLAQKAGTLSGGEQQMLAIGRAMMAEPVLLVLDEPSVGLSPLLVEEMFALIGRLKERGLTILLVEQNVMQSLEIADRAFVMANGEITLSGKASEMMDDPELQRSYLGLA